MKILMQMISGWSFSWILNPIPHVPHNAEVDESEVVINVDKKKPSDENSDKIVTVEQNVQNRMLSNSCK